MNRCQIVILSGSLVGTLLTSSVSAQQPTPPASKTSSPAGKPSEAEIMAKMAALAEPGEQHRLLAGLVGTWTYTVKFGSTPGAPLADAGRGTAVRTALMGGRYFQLDAKGTILMQGADGKVTDSDFKGMSLEGYDNVKEKFVSTWIDNMGTSIVFSEGTYDPATKSFTYLFEMEMLPGMKTKAREVLKVIDADHHQLAWYETHGGQEINTMEIDYTRQK